MRLPATGNRGTFGLQLDILLKQADSEMVYFAEDDYFYLPGQFFRMLDFLKAFRRCRLCHAVRSSRLLHLRNS